MSLQFSIAAGFVLGGGFLVAPFAIRRRVNEPLAVGGPIAAAGLLLLASIVWLRVFPATIDAGGAATAFARLSPLCLGRGLARRRGVLHHRQARAGAAAPGGS